MVYRNLGDGRFADFSFLSGLDSDADGRAFAVLDIDGDGALDLALKNRTAPQLRLMRNTVGGRSLIVELRGVGSNRDAVGARASLVTDRRTRIHEVQSGSAYLSQSSRRLHFALPDHERPVELRITWPGHGEQVVRNLPESGTIRIEEGGHWRGIGRPVQAAAPEAVEEPLSRPWLVSPVPAPLMGKPVSRWTLVNFAADWCPPCKTELADWQSSAGPLKAAGVAIRIINVDEAANRDLVAAYSLLYRNLYDLRREMGLPMTFLLDSSGSVVKIYQGLTLSREILADVRSTRRPSLPFAGLRITPQPSRNWNDIAGAMAEHGLIAPALLYFETAIAKGTSSDELRNNYAAVLMAAGETAKAEKLLSTMGERPEVLVNLGLLYLESNRPQLAVNPLERATRLQPDDGAAWGALGMAYGNSGKKREAIAALEKAQALRNRTANLANELGVLYMETDQPRLAVDQFLAAVELDSKHLPSHINLTMYYLASGDREAARMWLNKARLINANDEGVRRLEKELGR